MSDIPFHRKLLDRTGRIFPKLFWDYYNTLAKRQGFDRLYLLLSFDCDTPEDAYAAKKIDAWLVDHSIQRSYAVPGTMLEANPAIYRVFAEKGAEFLNHGFLPHTQRVDGIYRSTTFYAQMESAAVVEDIRNGHQTVSRVIGREPGGFRAPHFGMVTNEMKENLIRPVLREMGEYFTSQSTPFENMRYGPMWLKDEWTEFPVSGSTQAPFSILDSFSYLENKAVRKVNSQFSSIFMQTIREFRDWKICGLLNMYVDPSHVVDDPGFFEALQLMCDLGISSLTYTQVLETCVQDAAG